MSFFPFDFIQSILCVSISTIIWLNKKLILINTVIEYNRVNGSCYEIKYLDLHLSHNFSDMYFIIVNDFFFNLLT